jgi:CRISPR/Cas system CSM-associated protein Csm3 (group 7 of RAMP superfamily)
MDFSRFENKYILKGKLIVENGLHIGSGELHDEYDAPFIKYEEGKYYVPGSSFRGYLRTKIERLLNNDFKIKIDEQELDQKKIWDIFGAVKDDIDNNEDIEKAGKIFIPDMKIIKKSKEVTRDGIKIDRNTGTTELHSKFDYNFLSEGAEFEFEIILENVDKGELELVLLGLQDIIEGDLFGGKLSRGIGKTRLELTDIKYIDLALYNNNEEKKKILKEYLFKRKMQEINNDGITKFIEEKFNNLDINI